MKNVQIPYELFFKIIKYHLLDMYDESEEIKKGEDEREKSRKEYLDMIGMHSDFRW